MERMKDELKTRLAEKGWSKKEIKKTAHIIEKSEIKKSKKVMFLDKYVYLISLFVGIIGNLIISIALIPFLLALESFQLYLVIVVLGMSFGLFFEILIRDIENLEAKHHITAGIVIPCLALVNMYIITLFSYNISSIAGIRKIMHIPMLIGFVYAVSFIAPYVFYRFLKKRIW